MDKILVAGVLSQPFGSISVASQSSDGISWSTTQNPFKNGEFCTGLATDGNIAVISNAFGYASVTNDMENFSLIEINDGFGTIDIDQAFDANGNSHWLAVGAYNYLNGYGPYPSNSEVAQIYRSSLGSIGWSMVWSHQVTNSRFYKVKYFTNAPISNSENANVWVACGYQNTVGDIWYSLDYGVSWTEAPVPSNVGPIYSVELYQLNGNNTWYWGCSGKLYFSTDLQASSWGEVLLLTGDIAIDSAIDTKGSMIFTGINNIYITGDGLNFRNWNYPGYVFDKVLSYQLIEGTRWFAFARSILTRYTMWYTDDLVNWYPLNNSIQTQGCSAAG